MQLPFASSCRCDHRGTKGIALGRYNWMTEGQQLVTHRFVVQLDSSPGPPAACADDAGDAGVQQLLQEAVKHMIGQAHAQDGADDGPLAAASRRANARVCQNELGDLHADVSLARSCGAADGKMLQVEDKVQLFLQELLSWVENTADCWMHAGIIRSLLVAPHSCSTARFLLSSLAPPSSLPCLILHA